MWWGGETHGWLLDIEGVAPDPIQLERATMHALKVQQDRLGCLGPGDRRDECVRTIDALIQGRVTLNFVGTGEKVPFDVYKSDKIFSFTK